MKRLGYSLENEEIVEDVLDEDNMNILTESLDRIGVKLSDDHFAGSDIPRDPKNPRVKYSVGQVCSI